MWSGMDRATGPTQVIRGRSLTGRVDRDGTLAYGEGVSEPGREARPVSLFRVARAEV